MTQYDNPIDIAIAVAGLLLAVSVFGFLWGFVDGVLKARSVDGEGPIARWNVLFGLVLAWLSASVAFSIDRNVGFVFCFVDLSRRLSSHFSEHRAFARILSTSTAWKIGAIMEKVGVTGDDVARIVRSDTKSPAFRRDWRQVCGMEWSEPETRDGE
jgi:hypothetical protein